MKSSDDRNFSVQEFVPYHFALLSSRLSKAIAQPCENIGLALSEWRLMAIIADGNGLSASDVSDRSTMDAVAVHRAVKSLLARSFISRTAVEGDRRIKRLVLTPAGRKAYEAIVPAAVALETALLSSLTPGEAITFRRLLRKLTEVRV